MNKREAGAHYEEVAVEYLKQRGYHLLKKNYRCRQGEVDLICRDGKYLVFIEVKYRTSPRQGSGFAAVDAKKQRRISRVAAYYLLENQMGDETPCRFDVVSIDGQQISLIKNAFDYCG